MSKRFGDKMAWFVLLAIVLAAAALVIVPVWLIQPFAPQTENSIEISFLLRRWSPFVTAVLALVAAALVFYIWKTSRRWFGKAALIVPVFFMLLFTWFARQNHFEWMFNPLRNSDYVKVSSANFVADDDMVLAVNVNGEAVAYPVRQMAYHHVVQDIVGGMPITATY
jgi:hypothetical protein